MAGLDSPVCEVKFTVRQVAVKRGLSKHFTGCVTLGRAPRLSELHFIS